MSPAKLKKLQDKVLDLGWDCQRMSSSGVETYNEICDLINIERYKD